MKETYEKFHKIKESAAKFVQVGGSEPLFWSGQLARAADAVIYSNTFNLSNNIQWLEIITREYNNVIIDMTNKKYEKEKT